MFYRLLDDGYNLAWRIRVPGTTHADRPAAVERWHSWVHILPALFLRKRTTGFTDDCLEGQATIMQIKTGTLFLWFFTTPGLHLISSREDLYKALDSDECAPPHLIVMHPGDIMLVPLYYTDMSPPDSCIVVSYPQAPAMNSLRLSRPL